VIHYDFVLCCGNSLEEMHKQFGFLVLKSLTYLYDHTPHGVPEFRPFASIQVILLDLSLSLARPFSTDLNSNIHSQCNESASYDEAFVFGLSLLFPTLILAHRQ
jgi:hypothetical protein